MSGDKNVVWNLMMRKWASACEEYASADSVQGSKRPIGLKRAFSNLMDVRDELNIVTLNGKNIRDAGEPFVVGVIDRTRRR
ncbi:hypothetical protein G5V57_31570 [Nordella sp. HKS 07]|uniref:hypothetical protein n=1 Tax=Nordella sp. HKS 07 TaxID=2712222 RepID=UPI0013E1D81B|nr:hypothetical protein [Nordella sp. HKS 07]QIG51849.1 hypothetical protein G5V57_31570 [Nordella sp. HKS 07]